MDDRDIRAELEADARDLADDMPTEMLDAEQWDEWQAMMEAEPEPPELPERECHDPIDFSDIPW